VSIPQVGQGSVAVVPTFKGFRKTTDAEFATSAKSGASVFNNGFKSAGATAGKGFASTFDSATKGLSSAAITRVQAEVAKASREVSALRLREQDATGKVRYAEAALGEARRKYSAESSQVIRAEERLATAQRTSLAAKSNLLGATERLTAAQRSLAAATAEAGAAGGRSGGVFANMATRFGSAGRDGAARFSQGFKDVLGGVLGANILTGIGYTIGRGIGNAARAGIGYALQSITLASDLEQSAGAVTAQFKDQSDVIFAASKRASTSVGLSRSTYQQYATVVGAQLKNLGLRQDQVSGKTLDLIELGADLAAQFGGPTSQAVEALSSLLRGERDPIERYGVSLKQQDINARLAAMGMADLTGEAEKQATIQATLALLWEQTADAQGTFARESETYAGKQQRLMAQLADAQTEFGETLLPTAIDVLEFANDDLLPVLKSTLAEAGPEISASLKAAMPEIEETLRGLGENLPGLINLASSVGAAIADSIEGDFGEGGILGGIPRVKSELEGFADWLTRDFSTYENWDDYWRTFGSGFEHWWDVAWDGVDDAAALAGANAGRAVTSAAREAVAADKQGLYDAGKAAADGIAEGLEAGKLRIGIAGAGLGGAALREFKGALEIESPSRLMRRAANDAGEGVALGLLDKTKRVADASRMMASAVAAPMISSGSDGVAGARAAAGGDRPIYTDTGALLGWFRQVAGEEARIVWADVHAQTKTASYGRQ